VRQELIDQLVKELGAAEATPLSTDIGGGWKDHPSLFTRRRNARLHPGVATFSPATYANSWFFTRTSPSTTPEALPPSVGDPASGALPFVSAMSQSFAILGGGLAATHPRLFDAGLQSLESLFHGRFPSSLSPMTNQLIQHWSSPFSAFDVAVNRETLLHRDLEGMPAAYSSILNIGRYDNGVFDCPSIGARFSFLPGTMMVGMTSVLEYGASPVNGDSIMITSRFDGQLLWRSSDLTPAMPPKLSWWDMNFLKPDAQIDQRGYRYKRV
jgi:hypothetical protein